MDAARERGVERLAESLRSAERIAVLTGAGFSAESGVPTFRDAMTGMWAKFDPLRLATPEAFAADPETVTRWYDWRRELLASCKPNPGHAALAELERWSRSRGSRLTVLTQNVDGLHHAAGGEDVVELHGSLRVWRCTKTGREVADPPFPFNEYPPRSQWGGLLRPGVVWFGEMLPPDAVEAAEEALATCDLFISAGTSAEVHPAAGFAQRAAARGAATAEINRDPTPISGLVDVSIRGMTGQVLPRLLELATAD